MKKENLKEGITKESYNPNGKSILEITNEWIEENYNKICCIIEQKAVKSNRIEE